MHVSLQPWLFLLVSLLLWLLAGLSLRTRWDIPRPTASGPSQGPRLVLWLCCLSTRTLAAMACVLLRR